MSRFRSVWIGLALLGCGAAHAQSPLYPGLGRAATPQEVAAWDIDVRPDFKGLPKGAGSVAKGMEVWEGKCASCHGVFGENTEVFNPIIGGTTQADIQTGRVASLHERSFPGRTTLMKLSTVSTLWDYINRAMPWNQPKSLSTEEVYAVAAYILNMAGVVPDTFTLSDRNIADVQRRLPNRNGMTADHALWPGAAFGKRKPDVAALACMKNCASEAKVTSSLPDHARNAHGNLAEQNRTVGPQRGADTSQPPPTSALPPRSRHNGRPPEQPGG
jgi:S-disulfanyl-L-cysteine oxidoreductase SoxD